MTRRATGATSPRRDPRGLAACAPTTRTGTCRSCAPTRSACCTGCATSAATSAGSGWPTATSSWSAAPRPTRRSSGRPDEVLDQAEAYPFMTPIFGKGVVFDASPERRQEMLKNQALRGEQMRGPRRDHRGARSAGWSPGWGDEGEIDLLDFFAELTIYTTSSCLIGTRFRERARRPVRAALPRPRARHRRAGVRRPVRRHRVLPPPRRRAARRWSTLVQEIIDRRAARSRCREEERDLLDVLISLKDDDGSRTSPPTRSPGCSSR